jgi:ergosteryl-3beta-O-L-aspartate synthase
LWLLCGAATEDVLSSKFDWRTFSPAAEQRIDPSNLTANKDPDVQRKVRHAEKEGVKIHDIPIGTPPSDEVRKKIDQRIEDWLANRKVKRGDPPP